MPKLGIIACLIMLLVACSSTPSSPSKPIIESFTANSPNIKAGESSTLSWTVTGADTLTLTPGKEVTGQTSEVVSPGADTTYTLTAINEAGSVSKSIKVTVTTEESTVSQTVKAADGGTLQTGGTTLVIPASALNQDTLVTLSVEAAPPEIESNPMQPAGPQIGVDLGGATLTTATLEMPYIPNDKMLYIVTESGKPFSTEEMPGTRVHATTLEDSTASLEIVRAGAYGVYAIPQVVSSEGLKPTAEGINNTSLQVPFYWQAGYPWCSPTSTSMYLNYFQALPGLNSPTEAPAGRVSNYYLSSLLDQDATSGAWVVSFLEAAKVPTDLYKWLVWDADLIPSAPFSSYIVLATTGAFGLGPMRPVLTTSDRNAHAFVITGLSADGIFINDSNARWNGTHPSLSWEQFRDQNKIGTENDELGTLFVLGEPRPETERRGSLELAPPTAEDMNRTVRFENPSGNLISNWYWDANPFARGYYFDDATKKSLWPSDNEFGRILPRSSGLEANFNVINITETTLNYEVLARLYINDSFKLKRSVPSFSVSAYDREEINLDFGNLASAVGVISGPVTGRIEINLRQNGVIQDVKVISFRLGPDPSDIPYVTIRNAGVGVTTLVNVPVALNGEAFDRYYLPDGIIPDSRLVWSENGSNLGNGPTLATTFSTLGQHTVTLTARSEYGVQASAGVFVNVIDPVRNPGEVVIDYPTNNTTIAINSFGTVDINLVGHATESDGTPVPSDRLFWTRSDGTAIGTGSSTLVTLPGFCSNHTYTINLTARKFDGSPVGTKSVTIIIAGPPC